MALGARCGDDMENNEEGPRFLFRPNSLKTLPPVQEWRRAAAFAKRALGALARGGELTTFTNRSSSN